MKDGGVTILSWEVYSCILFERVSRGSRNFSNKADILIEVINSYRTGGVTCYWIIRVTNDV